MDFDLLCLISMYEVQIYTVWIYSKGEFLGSTFKICFCLLKTFRIGEFHSKLHLNYLKLEWNSVRFLDAIRIGFCFYIRDGLWLFVIQNGRGFLFSIVRLWGLVSCTVMVYVSMFNNFSLCFVCGVNRIFLSCIGVCIWTLDSILLCTWSVDYI